MPRPGCRHGPAIEPIGDKGLAGRTIYVDSNHNGKLDSGELKATTAANGSFSSSDLPAGHYCVREVVPTGWRGEGTNSYDLALTAGQRRADKDFAQTRLGLIAGIVFQDKNANGKKDAGESALANWIVYLDSNDDGRLDNDEMSFTTGSDGKFHFAVAGGRAPLRIAPRKGLTATSAISGSFSVTESTG